MPNEGGRRSSTDYRFRANERGRRRSGSGLAGGWRNRAGVCADVRRPITESATWGPCRVQDGGGVSPVGV
jgi:hypothetical protein